MSTQPSDSSIQLSHHPSTQGYRLIELPLEVQALLEGPSPPVLTLSSEPTSAVLATPDRRYGLRQKNTSNALMLLAPSTEPAVATAGMSVVATLHETVELVPEAAGGEGAAARSGLDTGSRGRWHERFGRGR